MMTIGLTGGIASGKSAVSKRFERLGVPVIDADEVARDVVDIGQPGLAAVAELFGAEYLLDDGSLNRQRLRTRIFADSAARRALEAVLHPRIRAEIQRRIAMLDAPYCIVSIPLLVESGADYSVDRVLVVDVPETLQRQRLAERDGVSEIEIEATLGAQCSRSDRLREADDVILNDAGFSQLDARVADLHEMYLRLARGATRR